MRPGNWEQLGADNRGTVPALVSATSAGGLDLAFAATAVGVFQSSNGGMSWTLPATGDGVAFVEALAATSGGAGPPHLFAGTLDGLHRSSDAGQRWQHILEGSRTWCIGCGVSNIGQELVLAGTEFDGVLRSEDGGNTWSGANAGLLDLTVLSLAVSPRFESDGTAFAGTASGVYRTRNRAESWRELDTGFAQTAVQCLIAGPDGLVLAGTEEDGLLYSRDAGTTWQTSPAFAGRTVTALAISSRGTIAAATDIGIGISRDQGATWRTAVRGPTSILALTYIHGDTLLAGVEQGGVRITQDDGASWTSASVGLNGSLLSVMLVPTDVTRDPRVLVGGPHAGIRIWGVRDGTVEEQATGLADPDIFGLAESTRHSLFAASTRGLHVSRDGGINWDLCLADTGPARAVCGGTAVLAAFGDGTLRMSEDDGETWRIVKSPPDNCEIVSLARGSNGPSFAATVNTDETVVWRLTDGTRWERWLVEVGARRHVPLAISPTNSIDELVFVGVDRSIMKPRHRSEEVRGGERRPLWERTELGQGGLAITALAVSAAFATDRTMYVGTTAGVFVSRDRGTTFQSWNDGRGPKRIVSIGLLRDLANDRLVFVLELGGVLWCRRDY